ncbi:uncharacterized protein LOC142354279 [Convolutriloba macropyga]|uniref:uncharacterized protein LOC142354279 n=1 Tax=Convolutriloba macropyga TaxID=536237 RepID=UPI003F522CDF
MANFLWGCAKVAAKTAVVVGATAVGGPVGGIAATALITTGEVANDIAEGDTTSAVIDGAMGLLSIATFGVSTAAGSAAKEGAKKAVVNGARNKSAELIAKKAATGTAAKAISKGVGDQLGKDIATGILGTASRDAFMGSLRTSFKEGGKQIGKTGLEQTFVFGLQQGATTVAHEGIDFAIKKIIVDAVKKKTAEEMGKFVFGEAAKQGAQKALAEITAQYGSVAVATAYTKLLLEYSKCKTPEEKQAYQILLLWRII